MTHSGTPGTTQPQKLTKRIGSHLHGFLFFAPVVSPVSWAFLRYLYRNRPFLTTLQRALQLEGDVLECGVFWGRSIVSIALELKKQGKSAKKVFALDSFDGFRDDSIDVCDLGRNRTMEKVRSRFKQDSRIVPRLRRLAHRQQLNLEIVPGFFEDTLPDIVEGRQFCFVHLDCDIYSSYQTCLPLVYPRLVPGGILLFDEYLSPVWPGATQAIDEFFADKPEKPELIPDASRPNSPKYAVVKQ